MEKHSEQKVTFLNYETFPSIPRSHNSSTEESEESQKYVKTTTNHEQNYRHEDHSPAVSGPYSAALTLLFPFPFALLPLLREQSHLESQYSHLRTSGKHGLKRGIVTIKERKRGESFQTTISPANGNVKGSLVSSGYGDASGGTSKRCSVCVHLRVSRQADAPEQKSKKTCAFSLLLSLRGKKWGWGGLVS